MEKGFTHFDQNGNAVMVDVSGKQVTYRTALATGYISVGSEIMEAVTAGNVKKGDVLGVARVAGIMGVIRCRYRNVPLITNWISKKIGSTFSVL